MMKSNRISLICLILFFGFLVVAYYVFQTDVDGSSSQMAEPVVNSQAHPQQVPTGPDADVPESEAVDARIEYPYDVKAIDTYFVEARVYPGMGIPTLVGGFVETNVDLMIRVRGLSVPSDCTMPAARTRRPHAEIERERQRWDSGMRCVWRLIGVHKRLKLSNLEVMDGVLFCDAKFFLGGAWHDLAATLYVEGYARPDVYLWDWGLLHIEPVEKSQQQVE